jgi:hypothetical protein
LGVVEGTYKRQSFRILSSFSDIYYEYASKLVAMAIVNPVEVIRDSGRA